MVRRARNKESPPKIPKRSTVNSSRPVLNECLITTLRLCVSRENKCKIMLKRHSCVCRFAFLMVRHCVNLVKGVNDAFPAPISRDYRRSDIEGHMAEFILCWCNNSPPLKGRPAQNFSTVHVPQSDNAFLHTDPKLRRQRYSRVCLTFRQGKTLPLCILAHGKRHRRYCRQYQNYRLHIYRRKNCGAMRPREQKKFHITMAFSLRMRSAAN